MEKAKVINACIEKNDSAKPHGMGFFAAFHSCFYLGRAHTHWRVFEARSEISSDIRQQ